MERMRIPKVVDLRHALFLIFEVEALSILPLWDIVEAICMRLYVSDLKIDCDRDLMDRSVLHPSLTGMVQSIVHRRDGGLGSFGLDMNLELMQAACDV